MLVGLPDAVVRQSVDRVRAAVVNAGATFPQRRITIGLSPAAMPKQGSGFDLALAAGGAGGRRRGARRTSVDRLVLLGELGLDGSVRASAACCRPCSPRPAPVTRQVVVPGRERRRGRAGREHRGAGRRARSPRSSTTSPAGGGCPRTCRGPLPRAAAGPDLGDVVGQAAGRRAVEVAAAGGHHLFLAGPPGAGKTMLAERLPGLLPPLDEQAALEVTAIHSVAGHPAARTPRWSRRPTFEAPHHSATMAALIGGGSGQIRPGALCRAHRGVLFLDEAPEFPRAVLDTLRQPLERGQVTIHRAAGLGDLPVPRAAGARRQPVPVRQRRAATRPAPAARWSGGGTSRGCRGRCSTASTCGWTCPPVTRAAWLDGLGHAGDRPRPWPAACGGAGGRGGAAGRDRSGGEQPGARPAAAGARGRCRGRRCALAERALERGALSVRGFDRVLRVAWTLADLAGRARPGTDEVAEALGMRLQRVAA